MYSNLNGEPQPQPQPQPQAHHPHSHSQEGMDTSPGGSAKAGRRHLKRVGVLVEHDLEAHQQKIQRTAHSQHTSSHHGSQHPQQEVRLLTDPTIIGTGPVSNYFSGLRGPSSLRQQYLGGAGAGVPLGAGAAPVPGPLPLNNVGIAAASHIRRRADLRELSTTGSLRGAGGGSGGSGSGSVYNAEINNFAAITALNQVHRPDASLVTASTSSNTGAPTFLGLDAEINMNAMNINNTNSSLGYPQHQHQRNPPSAVSRIGSTASAAGAPQQLLVGADNNLMLAPLGVSGQNVFVLPASNQQQSQQLVYIQDQPAPSVHASEHSHPHSHSQLVKLVVGPNGQQYITNIDTPSVYSASAADDQHIGMTSVAHVAAVSAANHQAQAQAQNIISGQQLQQLSLQQQARNAAAVAIQNQHQRMQVTRLLLEERQRQTSSLYSGLQGAGSVLDGPYIPTSSAQELLLQARMQGERQARLHGDNLSFAADVRSINGSNMSQVGGGSYLNGIGGRAEQLPQSLSRVSAATSSQKSEDVHSLSNSTSNNSNTNSTNDDIRISNADKPRRPLSAYNFFFSEERERILAEFGKNSQLLKEKEMKMKKKENDAKDGGGDGKDKDKDKDKKDEKGPSQEEIDDFLEGPPVEFSEEERKELEDRICAKTKKILEVNLERERPKKAPHRKSHGLGLRPLSKAIAVRWRNLTTERRDFYDKLAKQDLQRYKKSMKACSLRLSSHYKKK